MLSVASSCHYNGNSKMAKIVQRQMPAPRKLSQQIPASGQKLGCKSPRVGANFWCKSPGVRGGIAMDEIDTCITESLHIIDGKQIQERSLKIQYKYIQIYRFSES